MNKIKIAEKTIYYSLYSALETAERVAWESPKAWVATHPAVTGFMVVRPVDAARIEKDGGKIVPYWSKA